MLTELLSRKNILVSFLTFLLILLSTLLPRPARGAEMPVYERLQPITSSIPAAIDVATDQLGRLYVADSVNNSVVVFDNNGQYTATRTGLYHPLCVTVDADGNIYIGNKDTANVEVYDSSFTLLHKLRTGDGDGDGEFIQPNDLAIAAAGQIYVVDRGADIVKVYDAAGGNFSFSFDGSGNGNDEFQHPVSIAIDEGAQELIVLEHQLYLTRRGEWIDGARIEVFDMNGAFKRGFTKFNRLTQPGYLYKPQRVTVDEQSRLYVTESFYNVVQVYNSSDGAYLGAVYDLQDPLRTPVGVTLGGNNLLYVAARGTGQVEVYQLDPAIPASAPSAQAILMGVSPLSLSSTAAPAKLSITPPSALTFTSTNGSIPAGRVLSIENMGSGTLSWSASAVPSWILLDKTSGTAPDSVTVAVDITSLAAGEHMSAVTIDGDGALSSPTHIGVTLTIVQSAPGTEDLPPGDGRQPSDNESDESAFPWILFKHLLGPW